MTQGTVLVVVVTNRADAQAMASFLAPQLPADQVVVASGYYAGVAAVDGRARAVIIDVGLPSGRDDWRLAELRVRQPDAAVVVVADAALLPGLARTVRADLSATRVDDLPPLRELLVSDEPVVRADQTSWRRSRR